ncbi:MAG TPA: sigma-70 family RNA polymerase sigma factor [Acidimicrobiia bacterium]
MAHDVRASETELAERARAGDAEAFGLLYDAWFDRVHDLARRIVHDPAGAADVTQDAFLAAWRGREGLRDPAAFGGWLLRITRNAAFDRRRRDQRASPVDGEAMAMIEDRMMAEGGPSPAGAPSGFGVEERAGVLGDPARVAEDDELVALVWESADALGPRDAEVLHLSLRHHLPPAEIAETIGVTRNHANQLVHRVKQRLGGAIRARVLWRGGRPACDDLAAALAAAGVERFGPEAVTVATEHADHCDVCAERRTLRLAPTALFAATPIAAAPAALKEQVARALARAGVPMEGSRHAPRARSVRVRRFAWAGAGLGVVALVLATAAVVLAGGGDAPAPDPVAGAEPEASPTTTTTTTPTTTNTTAGPAPDPQPIAPGGGPALAPPADPAPGPADAPTADQSVAPPPPPPPPPPPVTADLALAPATMPDVYPMSGAPVLTWSTTGGAAVVVSGPGLGSMASPSGSAPICPGSSASVCTAAPGTYTYTLVVWDAHGQVAAQRSATLTIA